jgi:ATP/maltotriose-dependent transcriptional regulator MalT
MFRANLYENDGDVAAMSAETELALAEFREIGERWGLANTLRARANVLTLAGDLDGAQAAYEEALDLMAQLQSREDEAFLLVRMGELAMRRGDSVTAKSMIERARASAEDSGSPLESVFTLAMLAEIERQAGDVDLAREMHREALRRITTMPPGHPALGHAHAIVHAMGARLLFGDREIEGAREYIAIAWSAAVATEDLPITAAVGLVIAEMVAGSGLPERAAELLGATARLRGADDPTAPDIKKLTATLAAALGRDGFDEAYAGGKSLDRAEAIARLDPAVAFD